MSIDFSSDEYEYGDLGVTFEAGSGWGGNGKKAYHYVLVLRDLNDEDNELIVAMTPEDAKHLAGDIFAHTFFVEGWEEADMEFHPEDYEGEEEDEDEDDERCSEGRSATAPTP